MIQIDFDLRHLRNRYLGQRHGFSGPNSDGIILSSRGSARYDWITQEGIQQAYEATLRRQEQGLLTHDTKIATSEFPRAIYTGEQSALVLGGDIFESPLLNERRFGLLESASNDDYRLVWKADRHNANNKIFEVESPNEVATRISTFVNQMEEEYEDATILLVSHGDTLSIAQTVFLGVSPAIHRSFPQWRNGEIKRLSRPFAKH